MDEENAEGIPGDAWLCAFWTRTGQWVGMLRPDAGCLRDPAARSRRTPSRSMNWPTTRTAITFSSRRVSKRKGIPSCRSASLIFTASNGCSTKATFRLRRKRANAPHLLLQETVRLVDNGPCRFSITDNLARVSYKLKDTSPSTPGIVSPSIVIANKGSRASREEAWHRPACPSHRRIHMNP